MRGLPGPPDPVETLAETLPSHLGQDLVEGPTHDVCFFDHLAVERVGEFEDMLGTAEDADGRGRLHQERVEAVALGVALRLIGQLALVLLLAPLVLDQEHRLPADLLALQEQLDEDRDLRPEDVGIEGLDEVVDGAVGVAPGEIVVLAVDRGEKDDRYLPRMV